MSYCGPCPLCGAQPFGSSGHACVPKPPIRGIDYPWPPGPAAKKPRRTVCADCRHYRARGYDSITYLSAHHVCAHENARNLITGEPTSCSRNLGNCPDYQEKQP